LLVVANWPEARINHWDALLRARAIENQCYVVAVNRVGKDIHGQNHSGHSSVYDMNGTCLLMMEPEKEGTTTIRLDKEALNEFRSKYRFLQDRDPFSL
jgi:predicted amidohydrolase